MKIEEYVIKELQSKTKTKVSTSSKVSALQIDSLDMVEVVIAIENKFGINIDDNKLKSLSDKTVLEVIELFKNTNK